MITLISAFPWGRGGGCLSSEVLNELIDYLGVEVSVLLGVVLAGGLVWLIRVFLRRGDDTSMAPDQFLGGSGFLIWVVLAGVAALVAYYVLSGR